MPTEPFKTVTTVNSAPGQQRQVKSANRNTAGGSGVRGNVGHASSGGEEGGAFKVRRG